MPSSHVPRIDEDSGCGLLHNNAANSARARKKFQKPNLFYYFLGEPHLLLFLFIFQIILLWGHAPGPSLERP